MSQQEDAAPLASLSEAREAHYRKWLGTPAYVWHEDASAVPHVDVYIYPPGRELNRDSYTLITSGMSDARMSVSPGAGVPDRAELVQYVGNFDYEAMGRQCPWYVSAMLYLALYPFAYRTWLGPGHTVPNGEPPVPLAQGSLLTTALFLEPRFEEPGFRAGPRWQDERVGFLWLTFITSDELAFKLERGSEALVDNFEQQHLPKILETLRPSLVPPDWRSGGSAD